jgi:hypothetical protein
MRLFLHDGPSHVQLLSRREVREFRDLGAAIDFLRPLMADPRNVSAVRAELTSARTATNGELLEMLARRMVAEGLQLVSCADAYFAAIRATGSVASTTAQTTPREDQAAAQAAKEVAPGPEEKHWLEIELIDDDGNPVAGELYFIELPDGSTLSGTTDAEGRARIEDVDPGSAQVSFPNMDKKAVEPT